MFVVSGPGGVGKDTIVSRLRDHDPHLWLSRSWTTRAPRPHEGPDAYNFVDRPTFEAHARKGGFFEWAEYLGDLYGTPVPDAPPGRDVVLVIEVQGARQVLDRAPGTVMVLIVPPSADALAARLRARGDDEARVERRLSSAPEEIRIGRELAHHVVVNDDLDRAVSEVAGILERHRDRGSA